MEARASGATRRDGAQPSRETDPLRRASPSSSRPASPSARARSRRRPGSSSRPRASATSSSDLEELGYLASAAHERRARPDRPRVSPLHRRDDARCGSSSAEENANASARASTRSSPGPNFLRETGKLLSELTGTAAVVVSPRAETLTLKHLRFIRTLPGEVLAVLVMSNGTVQNRFLQARRRARTSSSRSTTSSTTSSRGARSASCASSSRGASQSERVQNDAVAAARLRARRGRARRRRRRRRDVVIEGRAKLLEQPEFADAEGLKQVVNALDEPRAARPPARRDARGAAGASVVVGREAGDLGGGQLSIVGASYTRSRAQRRARSASSGRRAWTTRRSSRS